MSGPVKLNRRLALEAPVRVPDGAGGYLTSWGLQGYIWGLLTPGTGREGLDAGLTQSEVPYRITVRAAPHGAPARPKAEQRFRLGTRVFHITAVTDSDAAGRYLTCHAREEALT
ncbi:head-tail adaptor protein [Alphaproteobacteria bacterium KMM 3653]|uniref:Head-tail adaptor protein n=1 Tax=Harenicola maris TaxID=2841044 RepID=A0AAP2CSZ9_9RHOB|nr:head-tail adaptor protein [Harenicola maris]